MENDSSADPLRAAAQARLAAIVESSDDAIVSKNLDGVVMSWNNGAERIFGWTAAEVVGKPITIIIPPERLQEEPQILARLRAGERVDHFETVRMTKDGRRIDISVTISPIRDDSGRVIGASKIARDVTLQKRFQQEVVAAKEVADAARKAAEVAKEEAEAASRAKDHFLSVLSHELRTPLTPVLGAISLIEADGSAPPQFLEQVRMIRRSVETEARLVDDLLDLTRIARGKVRLHFEVLDAHAAARGVLSMFQNELDARGYAVPVALRAKDHHVWADPGRFQQVLLNLVSNAVKFTPPDGEITLRSSSETGRLTIEVIDSGVGMEPEVIPTLFDAFVQGERGVTRKFGGLGLGLSIVRSLVQMHGGTIAAHSEGKDRGSTFTLSMPTVEPPRPQQQADFAPAGAAADGATGDRQATGGGYRVLLVEDHADTRDVLRRLLKSFGCAVTTAETVREAVELSQREQFDLLVSDIGLPDGSGTDVMRRLRESQGVRGIALSGDRKSTRL